MNKWKEDLKLAFDMPQPLQKNTFLRTLEQSGISVPVFLISQIGYIRKWVWCIYSVIFIVSLFGATFLPDAVVWLLSGLTPLLALTVTTESGRSEAYKMAELEMATRFSLKSVTFARLTMLGLTDLLLLGLLVPIGLCNNRTAPTAAALYIITPYLLSAFTGLWVFRKLKGQEAIYTCIGASVVISIFLLLSHALIPFLYQEQCLPVWSIAFIALLFASGRECIKILKRMEEFTWNLS